MGTFYDEWLGYWDDEKAERAKAKKYINEEDMEWVRTRQDFKAAPLCTRENGFITAGNAMIAELPTGWRTGKHVHGEEAMFILEGEGFSVIDNKRYDWDQHSCIFVPFGAPHQHFNQGDKTVRYLSFTGLALERFAGLARIMQVEEMGEIALREAEGIEVAPDVHPELGRIVLRRKDALEITPKDYGAYYASRKNDEFVQSIPSEMKTVGAPAHRSRIIEYMGPPQTEFKAREVEITGILCDEPGMHSGKHAHMEALLYVIQGEGYSVIDGDSFKWKKGTLFQVQGPQSVHQHWNTGKIESQQLRIHYGLRAKFFQPICTRTFPYKYYEFGPYKPT